MFRNLKKQTPKVQGFTLQASVDDSIEIRTESLHGREYLVVPVVAMVEGVRFGANADEPELGLSSEFGSDVIMWANRPLVLNHPQIEHEGEMVFCSANFPEILESYAFGMTMNPFVEDSKLKMEAWIDIDRVNTLGGEFSDIVELIQAQSMVEVSVGFFSQLEKKAGKFRGQKYGGIWRNIKPDHLAILSVGTLGACNNEDGCGIPRINQEAQVTTPTPITIDPVTQKADCGCGCGGACKGEPHTHEEHDHTAEPTTQWTVDQSKRTPLLATMREIGGPELELLDTTPITNEAQLVELEEHLAAEVERSDVRSFNVKLIAQAVDGLLMDRDVRTLVYSALRKKWPSQDLYLTGFTQTVAIFEMYGRWYDSYQYKTFQIGINVSETGVEFVGDPQEVVLLTKIVPQGAKKPTETSPTTQEETNMTETTAQATQTPTPAATSEPVQSVTPTPVAQATQTPVAPMSVQQYIDQAPAGMRDVLTHSLRMHESHKNGLIEKIKANKSNKFSEDQLKAFEVGMLENLAALAGVDVVEPNYGGVAHPVPVAQAADEAIPAPPRLFAVKTETAA